MIPDGATGDIKLGGGETLHFDCLTSSEFPLSPVISSVLTVSDQMRLARLLSTETFTPLPHTWVNPSLQIVDDAFPPRLMQQRMS